MKGPDEIGDLVVELEVLTHIGDRAARVLELISGGSFLGAHFISGLPHDKVPSRVCGEMSYGLNQQVDSGCPSEPFSIQDGLKWHRRDRVSLLKCLGHRV